jgi:hypothetical protein
MITDTTKVKRWGRWLATFIGFPAAGLAARAVAGNMDSIGAAALGGLAGGAVLGGIQAYVGGIPAADRLRWSGATAVGFAVGLTTGAGVVGFRTDSTSLVVMGAVSGAAVGLAQVLAAKMTMGDRALWALATPVLWAGGWLISSQVIVDADRQHAIFGSSGALTVAALAGVLFALRRPVSETGVQVVAANSTGSVVA